MLLVAGTFLPGILPLLYPRGFVMLALGVASTGSGNMKRDPVAT